MGKNSTELLKEKLEYNRTNVGEKITDIEKKKAWDIGKNYCNFLDQSKTERAGVNSAILLLQEQGFVLFDRHASYKPGDKIYKINRGKSIISAVIGEEPIEKGTKIIASHIDSPRLDLKQKPLYEEGEIAFLKTHYYGGLKKYQWTAMPLALVGVIVKEDGTIVDVNIGLEESDPVFCVTDLLPHLGKDQMAKKANEVIEGEQLNILVGLEPYKGEKVPERVKLNILTILNEKYDIVEEDFTSAELEVVPAFPTKEVGLDRSMIGGYGQDDRVCAYLSLLASMEVVKPKYTTVTILADKEETGSDGNTGLKGSFLKYFIYDLAENLGCKGRDVISNSKCLSADVSAGFDPNYPNVMEKNNTAYMNHGTTMMKYTGARGKGGTSDASAEFVGEIRTLLNKHNILWQTAELGKIDQGGGGTVASYIANLDVDVLDIGVPVLSMHSPFEIVSKLDMYMTYRTFIAFYTE